SCGNNDGNSSSSSRKPLRSYISMDPREIKPVNIFTYQMLSVPLDDEESFDRISENIWADEVAASLGIAPEEALHRISLMKISNPGAYKAEISRLNKRLRRNYLSDPDYGVEDILHPNTVSLITKLKDSGIKTVIFDECHHLRNYWALTMKEIVREIRASSTIGLTATPPLDEGNENLECYAALLGDVIYSIPTPAVVKEGMLAPYQDLVYFCTPRQDEMQYLKECHYKFNRLVEDVFNKKDSDFYYWIHDRIVRRQLLSGDSQDWTKFLASRPDFAVAGVRYLLRHGCSLPWEITLTDNMYEQMALEDWSYLIEDYALNLLKLSSKAGDAALYMEIRNALKSLGYVLTEKGMRRQSSPLDRILAYSRSKLDGLKVILEAEIKAMGDKIRAAIITDFEISNALMLKKTSGILDSECGGAVSVIRALAGDVLLNRLDPVMITSGKLMCPSFLAAGFIESGSGWARENGLDISLCCSSADPQAGTEDLPDTAAGASATADLPCVTDTSATEVVLINGSGRDWNSKNAVLMTTFLFEKGITKCIAGTRGLLSEGWDSVNLNTLIDLTAVTTFASVNQLRGRCMRKDKNDPQKVSNIWDITCVAPGLEKGYNDLSRLYRKHDQYYGVCDDSQIQRGINHVDPSIGIFGQEQLDDEDIARINNNMLSTFMDRQRTYSLWRIGEPFENVELDSCEIKLQNHVRMKAGTILANEKNILKRKTWSNILNMTGTAIMLAGAGAAAAGGIASAFPALAMSAFFGFRAGHGIRETASYLNENFLNMTAKSSVMDFARCILHSLAECDLINKDIGEDKIVITERSDGTVRAYLDGFENAAEIFSNSLAQVFSPIEAQRYAIQRYEAASIRDTPSSRGGSQSGNSVNPGSGKLYLRMLKIGKEMDNPVLVCYHPVPDIFNIKEKALVFKKYWNKYVSPGEIIFLKSEKGLKIVEQYGRVNFLKARKKVLRIWK
ncbi:MAG: DEAD/DEAH box helicase family protein, partial [Eubacteriales bacterium]|nr:DEAD/DEAH box helicase family protein [Eubacteriales bacterium]